MGITEKMKNAALNAAIQQVLSYLEKDPETNIPKLMDLVDKLAPEDWYSSQRAAFRRTIDRKDNWYQLIMKVYELDPEVGKALLQGRQADIKSSDLTLVQEGRRRGYYDSGTYKTWKKCGNCGFETEEDFEYCPKCGRRL